MPNFKSQGFKIKEIYVIVLSILSVYLPVQVNWWFLASDGSEIQASVKDFSPISLNFTSNIRYLLSHTLIKVSVFVVYGSFIFHYTTIYTPLWNMGYYVKLQLNLAQSILELREIKFVQMTGHALFYREMKTI